ncbi:type III effector [Pseudomonas sp. RGM 3321]|uniref:type III effector n=1 Tax=Pseudomonas sp. RGM 3321 TaxID=2930089 RepID=UPI001FCBA885|nr:type III effector [Pseudomonas sp. RGM 3321]MCJ2371267.1 type III effector [Pseudomonas sp. RGM 3321]
MPINRPAFNLKLNTAIAQPTVKKDAGAELRRLNQREVRANTQTRFAVNHRAPTYEVAQSALGENHGGWTAANHFKMTGSEVFIHMDRLEPNCKGEFAGDKIHLSVAPEDVPDAFNAIGKILQASDSPVDSWKVTDMKCLQAEMPAAKQRVALGAQFTIYAKPDRADNTYSPEYMGKMRGMISSIEQELSAAGVRQSSHRPDSDVSPGHWSYASYRNEHKSNRSGTSNQHKNLEAEPFFQLVSFSDGASGSSRSSADHQALLPPPWAR